MIIVMEMSSGRTRGEVFSRDGEACSENLNAAGLDVPRIEARLEEVAASAHRQSAQWEMAGFMASLYAADYAE
jgi:hypothetical protein